MAMHDAQPSSEPLPDIEGIRAEFRELNDRSKSRSLDTDEVRRWDQLKQELIAVLSLGDR
jgi:hypothetical protein